MPKSKKIPLGVKKKKIIDALPAELKAPLNKPGLKDLTFADLDAIETQLEKLAWKDPLKYTKAACGACSGWPN
jgi:hypothetical protein